MFDRLPHIEWSAVHALADRLTGATTRPLRDLACARCIRVPRCARADVAGERPEKADRYANAWEEIGQAARETEVFSFDKKALVLEIFERLERAARG